MLGQLIHREEGTQEERSVDEKEADSILIGALGMLDFPDYANEILNATNPEEIVSFSVEAPTWRTLWIRKL